MAGEIGLPRIQLKGKRLPRALFEPVEKIGMQRGHGGERGKNRLDFTEPKQGLDRWECFARFPPAERIIKEGWLSSV